MKFYDLNSFYIVSDIKEHQKNKFNLLTQLNRMPQSDINDVNDKIIKTDWNLNENISRDYYGIFYDMISPVLDEMAFKTKHSKWNIDNYWYQIYTKNNTHSWHGHNKTNWTNVYYLHLENKEAATQLYDIKEDKIIDDIKVKEGQLLTFPAHVLHRSPPSEEEGLKVVIAFNCNFEQTTLTF